MSTPTITGSCNCTLHKFTIPKPTAMNLCHCLECIKWAGAMHSAHIFAKTSDVDFHACPEPKTWSTMADSGTEMVRAWCQDCGAGLWIKARDGEMTNLKAGLFKPEDIPNPTMENWLKNIHWWETPAKGDVKQAQGNDP